MTGGLLLDLVLIMILLAYGVSGYRHGLISSVFSLVGFFAGALLGVWLLPVVLANWDAVTQDTRTRVLFLIVGVIALGWLGQVIGAHAGALIRKRMGYESVRRVDSALGAIVVVVATSLIIWFLAGSLRTAGNPTVARAMSDSRVLRVVNGVVPESAGQLFAGFRGFLSSQGFPQVFGGLAPEPITPVQNPDPAVAKSQAIARARASVVKITTVSESCQRGQEGTGWVVSPGRIVTNAHVVAGADQVRVEGRNGSATGHVVVFDPGRDLAIISATGFDAPALRLGDPLTRGSSAAVPGFPLDGPYTVVSARVRATLDARGLDIYGQQHVVREIYSLNATVQPGNSGGPLLNTRGEVVGVVFAKSLEDDRTGYALTLAEAKPVLDVAVASNHEVKTGACVAG